MYSHSEFYIKKLAKNLNFRIYYFEKGVHEFHKGVPVNSLIYGLEKIS